MSRCRTMTVWREKKMEPSQKKQSLEYRGIRLSPDGLAGIQLGRAYALIPHDEIRRITLRRGSSSAHPIIQIFFGAALAALGAPVIIHLIHWIHEGGTILIGEDLLLILPAIGVFLVFSAFGRSLYLSVEKQSGHTKLAFDSGAEFEAVQSLLAAARPMAKCPIEIDSTLPR